MTQYGTENDGSVINEKSFMPIYPIEVCWSSLPKVKKRSAVESCDLHVLVYVIHSKHVGLHRRGRDI